MKEFGLAWFRENVRISSCEVDYYCTELSKTQLNWKAKEDQWSIGQCLEHLINTNHSFFLTFEKCGRYQYKLPYSWLPFIPRKAGEKVLSEITKLDIPQQSPELFEPIQEGYTEMIVTSFSNHQRDLIGIVDSIRHLNFDQEVIASPALGIIHYSLRDAIKMLIFHEQRHLEQIKALLNHEDFPIK